MTAPDAPLPAPTPERCACGATTLPGRGVLWVVDGKIHGRTQCSPGAEKVNEQLRGTYNQLLSHLPPTTGPEKWATMCALDEAFDIGFRAGVESAAKFAQEYIYPRGTPAPLAPAIRALSPDAADHGDGR